MDTSLNMEASGEPRPFIPPPPQSEEVGLKKYRLPGCGMIFFFIALAWGIEIFDHFPGVNLDSLGVRPRRISGLIGVLTMPWLHGSFGHLISNTLTFAGLGYLVLATERERFFSTSLQIILFSGLGTWLIGRGGGSVHIGASALIYGYFGYLVTRALTEKKVLWTLFGLVLLFLYGGMIFGILPTKGPISWEGHLAGFVSGVWLARKNIRRTRLPAYA